MTSPSGRATWLIGLLALALAFSSVSAPASDAGPNYGRVETNFYSPSYERGAINVSLFITAIEERQDADFGKHEFSVYYNSRVFKFLGSNNGPCTSKPVKVDNSPDPYDTYLTCQQKPGDKVHKETFYFGVWENAPLGRTGIQADAVYGKVRAHATATTEIGTARPQCASDTYNFRGFCIPNNLSLLIDGLKQLQRANELTPNEQRSLFNKVVSYEFWRQVGKLAQKSSTRNAVGVISQLVETYLANVGRAS